MVHSRAFLVAILQSVLYLSAQAPLPRALDGGRGSGPEAVEAKPDPVDDAAAEARRVALCQSHYAEVERELVAADVQGLSPEQRARRAQLLVTLRAYRERGVFGRNLDYGPDSTGERVPQFVDRDERLCAVAELLRSSGERDLIEEVRRTNNRAWICDLSGHAGFRDWLARCGLSIEEAARIQVPGTSAPGDSAPPDSGGGSGGSSGGAGAPGGAAGSTGGSGGSPGGGALPAPGSASPTTGAGGVAGSSRAGSATTVDAADSWWLWWEYNKLAYLKPNRLVSSLSTRTGSDAEEAALEQIAKLRAAHTPWLVESLAESDAMLRGTLAVTLGRTAGEQAVEPLKVLLGDKSVDVRHRAILALGATGAPRAAELLLTIARTGATEKGGTRISRLAPAHAIVALGLGRRSGFGAELDGAVARLVQKADKGERELVTTAAMIYQSLAPCAELGAVALEVATSRDESVAARCRAIEALRGVSEPAVLSKLQDLLSGSRLELRRSAALVLGGARTTLALPALMTAYELEAEPLTRGFLLIAMGEQGGDKAQSFLAKQLEKGDKGLRPWSALALGIASRDVEDEDLREALRAATEREKNEDTLGAYWIASGLARDELATETIRGALARAANPRMRMYAATALALIGTDAAHEALLACLATDGSAMVRVTIGQALGELGRTEDAGAILGMLDGIRDPALQGLTAVAVSFHGSSEALQGLTKLARAEGAGVKRAAAIDGIGMLLGRSLPLAFGEVSRGSNFTVSPDWVLDLYQVTL